MTGVNGSDGASGNDRAATLASGAGAGNPGDEGAANGGQGSSHQSQTSFMDFIGNDENRKKVTDVGWKNLDQVVEAYSGLESKLGKSIVPPGPDASPEEWEGFYGKLGRPENADGYEIRLDDESIPKDMPYDETLATQFKVWAHEAGLTPRQAQIMHDKFVGNSAEMFKAAGAQAQQTVEKAFDALTALWGPDDGAKWKTQMNHAFSAVKNLDLGDTFSEAGFITKDGVIMNPGVIVAMAKVGEAMFAEGGLYSGGGHTGPNPFDPKTENLTEQGAIVRSDPRKAEALIRSAGRDPKEFGIGQR